MADKSARINLEYNITAVGLDRIRNDVAALNRLVEAGGSWGVSQGRQPGGGIQQATQAISQQSGSSDSMLHRVGRSQQVYDQAIINVLQQIRGYVASIAARMTGGTGGGSPGATGGNADIVNQLHRNGRSQQIYDQTIINLLQSIRNGGGGSSGGSGTGGDVPGDIDSGGGGVGGNSSFRRQRLIYGLMNPLSTFGGSRLLASAGPAGMFAAGAIGLTSIAKAGMGAATAVNNISNNADLTAAQKNQQIWEQLDFTGLTKSVREFRQSLDGTSERLRAGALLAERNQAANTQWFGALPQVSAMRYRSRSAANAEIGWDGASAGPLQRFDRSTAAGQLAFEQYNIRRPLADASAMSARQHEIAQANTESAQSEFNAVDRQYGRARGRVNQLSGTMRDIRGWLNSGRVADDPALRTQYANQLIQAERNLEQISNNRLAAQNQLLQSREAEAQAASRARQSVQAALQGELQINKALEDRLSSGAIALGGMGIVQRQQVATATEEVARYGPQGVTPEILQLAMQGAGRPGIERMMEVAGEASPEMQRIRATGLTGLSATDTLSSLRDSQATLTQSLREAVISDQQRLATDLRVSFTGAVDMLLEAMREIDRSIRNRIREAQRLAQSPAGL